MRSITGNKLASYKPKQDVFASLHELTKQNTIETGRSFIKIKYGGGGGGGGGKRMSWVKKIEKLISGVGPLLGTKE